MKSSRNLFWLVAVIVAVLIPLIIRDNNYFLSVFILCVINVILASSLRTIATTGQLCVGVMAFSGIGGYTSALLMMKVGLPIWATLPLAGLMSMAIAALIAYPSVRITGFYFAMMTLFFVQIVQLVLTEWRGLTGGSTGIVNIPSIGTLSIFRWQIDFSHFLPYSYFVIFIAIISLLLLYRIDRSHFGTFFSSIEQDEAVSKSVGINTVGFKVASFCIGSFFAGVAGCLYAHDLKVLVPDSFGLFPSIYIVIDMVAGGRKSFVGPIIGAVILTVLPQVFSSFAAYQPFIYVIALYLVLYLMPGGLVDLPVLIKSAFFNRRERRLAND
jgi:branched-chain amino acid transport system permease protein